MPKYSVKRHAVCQPLDQSYKIIPLTRGQNALVDTEDFERISEFNWIALWDNTTGKFRANRTSRHIPMEREVLRASKDEEIDHINLDSLDNRKKNLRKSTRSQNNMNRRKPANNKSGFKGVFWDTGNNRWRSVIYVNKKRYHLGFYKDLKDAAKAYDKAAKVRHGEFAHLNFP